MRLFLGGIIIGAILSALFLGTTGITGFAVNTGSETVNIDRTITSSTLIPISAAQSITSLQITGKYEGLGAAHVYLVGQNQTVLVASYSPPKAQVNNSFLLGKGGTVVKLDADSISFNHIFEDACIDSCEGEFTGPFYLQITLENGEFTLTSFMYESPELFIQPVEPPQTNETINITIPDETIIEIPTAHVNIASECSIDSDCGNDMMCHVGYCISDTGHLNITDSSGNLVALFDKFGRVLLKGNLFEQSNVRAPENAFTIEDRRGVVAFVTDEGDLHITGSLSEEVLEIPTIGASNFIIRNADENVCMIQGLTGDMYTVDSLVEGILN